MKFFVIGTLSLLTFMSSGTAQADCSALFNDLHGYVQPATIGNCQPSFNTLNIKMATNRNDNRYVSYAEGQVTEKITGGGRFPLFPSFGGTTKQTFSDRNKSFYETRCDAGSFCFPTTQNFATTAGDLLGLNFYNGSVVLTLKSWGNGKITVPVECTASGMMFGEKDGTLFTFSFAKTVYQNTCIR